MVLYRFIFHILVIPIVIGINETQSKVETAVNIKSSVPPKNLLQKEDNNTKKNITLAVEGGSIVVPETNLTFKENDAVILPKLPSEYIEETPIKNKNKHVVGRTGAPVSIELKDVSTKPSVVVPESTITNKSSTATKDKNTTIHNTVKTTVKSTEKTTVKSTEKTTVKPTVKPHKPLVLKYQEGSSIISERTSPAITLETSTAQANKPGSHPGMIMPVVITILVVPLFAVLGYMALKRGQEAWKNRHYKRMDFLLDGMYND